MHVEFGDATDEQMRGLFAQFYKEATAEQAARFQQGLRALLGEQPVSTPRRAPAAGASTM